MACHIWSDLNIYTVMQRACEQLEISEFTGNVKNVYFKTVQCCRLGIVLLMKNNANCTGNVFIKY